MKREKGGREGGVIEKERNVKKKGGLMEVMEVWERVLWRIKTKGSLAVEASWEVLV